MNSFVVIGSKPNLFLFFFGKKAFFAVLLPVTPLFLIFYHYCDNILELYPFFYQNRDIDFKKGENSLDLLFRTIIILLLFLVNTSFIWFHMLKIWGSSGSISVKYCQLVVLKSCLNWQSLK